MSGPFLAAVELGGTKSIAIAAEGGTIIDRHVVPTTDPAGTLGNLLDWLQRRSEPFIAFGMASFGPVRIDPAASDYGHMVITPKPHWSRANLLGPFASLGLPMAIDTDVNAAALAEYKWGAARGCSSVTYVTIGTGLGGGTLVEGRAIKGRLHPEIGHLYLRRPAGDGFAGACPFHGDCVEGLLCGPALEARFGEVPASVVEGDPRWDAPVVDLAYLLLALIHSYSPQRILVGGGVTVGAPWLLRRAKAMLPELLNDYYPDLVAAELDTLVTTPALGNDAGPLGAAAIAELALNS